MISLLFNFIIAPTDFLMNPASLSQIPNYSEEKRIEAENLNSVPEVELEYRGAKIRDKAENEYIRDASSPSKIIDGYDKLEIFERADKIMQDPLGTFNDLSAESCKNLKNIQEQHYERLEKIEEKTEIIEEIQTCEQPNKKFNCEKVLNLSCIASETCDFGGIVKDSVASDMKLDYAGNVLTIGTVARAYWHGWCQTYDRDTTFTIENKEDLTEFKLIEVGFDDYVQIKINDHIIYVGPDGGSKIEVVTRDVPIPYSRFNPAPTGRNPPPQPTRREISVFNGENHNICERNTNWLRHPDINLKPYLNEGSNKISMRVVVTRDGDGWLKIRANQHCCNNWQEQWLTTCS